MTSNGKGSGWIGIAKVMAHCGDSPKDAVHYVAGAIATAPDDPEPYAVLAELWNTHRADLSELLQDATSLKTVLAWSYISFLEDNMDEAVLAIGAVCGAKPDIPWTSAPWFGDERFRTAVGADALAEAVMRTLDYNRELDDDEVRRAFQPWFDVIDAVCERDPRPEAMARMAIFLRMCGRTDASFALCDRADSVERVMLTEVVRAGTWRAVGDPGECTAAFQRALAMDPANWSLYLDLADLHAEQGDFATAVTFTDQGLEHEPAEVTLLAAKAAYSARLYGSPDKLRDLIGLVPQMPNDTYRALLIDVAVAGSDLPADLVAEAEALKSP